MYLEDPWSVVDELGVIWDQFASEERGKDRLWEIQHEHPEAKGHTFALVNDRPWRGHTEPITYLCGEPITTKCIQDESWYSDYQAVVEIMCVGPNKDHTDFYERLPNGLEQAKEACRKYFQQFPGPQGWQMPDDARLERWIKSTWLSEEEMRLLDELRNEDS